MASLSERVQRAMRLEPTRELRPGGLAAALALPLIAAGCGLVVEETDDGTKQNLDTVPSDLLTAQASIAGTIDALEGKVDSQQTAVAEAIKREEGANATYSAIAAEATEQSATPLAPSTDTPTPVATEESVKPTESIEVSSVTITGVPLEGVSPTRYAGIIQPEQRSTIFPEGGFFFGDPGVITTNDRYVLENNPSAVDDYVATSIFENRRSEALLKEGGYGYLATMGGRIHVPGFGVDGQGITIDLRPEEGTGFIVYARGPFAEENRGSVTMTVDTPVGGSTMWKDITPLRGPSHAGFISDEQAGEEAKNMAGGLRENAENCSGVEGCERVFVVAIDVNRGEVGIWETTAENPGVMRLLWTNVVKPSAKN